MFDFIRRRRTDGKDWSDNLSWWRWHVVVCVHSVSGKICLTVSEGVTLWHCGNVIICSVTEHLFIDWVAWVLTCHVRASYLGSSVICRVCWMISPCLLHVRCCPLSPKESCNLIVTDNVFPCRSWPSLDTRWIKSDVCRQGCKVWKISTLSGTFLNFMYVHIKQQTSTYSKARPLPFTLLLMALWLSAAVYSTVGEHTTGNGVPSRIPRFSVSVWILRLPGESRRCSSRSVFQTCSLSVFSLLTWGLARPVKVFRPSCVVVQLDIQISKVMCQQIWGEVADYVKASSGIHDRL